MNDRYGGNPDVAKYLGVYLALGVGGAALVVVQTLILWIFCSIEVSNSCHPSEELARVHDIPAFARIGAQATRTGQRLMRVGGEL